MAALFVMLAACGPRPDMASQPFRNPDAPIYSSAVLEPDRMAGRWVQVAGFGNGALTCGPGEVIIADGEIRWSLCLDQPQNGTGALVPGKQGRFGVADMQDWWVLWVDGDYRTMVIGTPSGQFGFVLNREATLPADRARAVGDIFDFNGYDPGALQVF
ncbi:MAG: lipocalin family protein [Candidatus Saccharibacteria bacterium]|nr:lipocalin family protein [Pseudorhodobacter sp.]